MAKANGLPPAITAPYRSATIAVADVRPGDYIRNRGAERPGEYWPRVVKVDRAGEFVLIEAESYHTCLLAGDRVLACSNRAGLTI